LRVGSICWAPALGEVEVLIPELKVDATMGTGRADGAPVYETRIPIHIAVQGLKPLVSRDAKAIQGGAEDEHFDSIEDEIGFRTIETKGTRFC
jgi:hypothetical protein